MTIEDWRSEIDAVDEELLRLVNRRAGLAIRIGELKSRAGLPLRNAEREGEVLTRACRLNAGPLDQTAVAKIFRRIVRESRRAEARVVETAQTRKAEVS